MWLFFGSGLDFITYFYAAVVCSSQPELWINVSALCIFYHHLCVRVISDYIFTQKIASTAVVFEVYLPPFCLHSLPIFGLSLWVYQPYTEGMHHWGGQFFQSYCIIWCSICLSVVLLHEYLAALHVFSILSSLQLRIACFTAPQVCRLGIPPIETWLLFHRLSLAFQMQHLTCLNCF